VPIFQAHLILGDGHIVDVRWPLPAAAARPNPIRPELDRVTDQEGADRHIGSVARQGTAQRCVGLRLRVGRPSGVQRVEVALERRVTRHAAVTQRGKPVRQRRGYARRRAAHQLIGRRSVVLAHAVLGVEGKVEQLVRRDLDVVERQRGDHSLMRQVVPLHDTV